jgi:DNA-binding response OmpR family regulator
VTRRFLEVYLARASKFLLLDWRCLPLPGYVQHLVTGLVHACPLLAVMKKLLIVEDDPAVQKALKRLFEEQGYGTEIRSDGKSGLDTFRSTTPTAIVLDLGLPVMSGIDVCREIRQQSPTVPIIVLSASAEIADKVLLLELGADDYVSKPFSPRELLARVQAAIRHASRPVVRDVTAFDGISVDFARMEVTREDHPVEMTSQEFKILTFFVKNTERVISREELLREAFGYQDYSTTHTVDNHIFNLRQKLERDPAHPTHFRTVRGAGYRFVR